MARRAAPPLDDVQDVLVPVLWTSQRLMQAQADFADAIQAAYAHEPRPTYRQIGASCGLSEGAVRSLIHGRRS